MRLIEKIKNIFKKKIITTDTNLAKIDADLLFVPSFKELSKNSQEKVLQYLKEINIKDLDTIINYTKNLTEEANFNSEFLLRLYYKLTDDINLNKQDMLYDKYDTIIEINELNLCKNALLNLREEGILRIIALKELHRKETLRNLTFAGIFGKFEKIKRSNELKSLEDVTERLKIAVKVIEQLIQVININVETDTLKVTYEDNLLRLLNNKNLDKVIKDLVLETKELIKMFLPKYESKIIFNQNNIKECLMTLAISKRLLALYAYQHKDEAMSIIDDINKLCDNIQLENEYDYEKVRKDIFLIENKYKVFYQYLYNNQSVNEALKKLYKLKFRILIKNNYSFDEIKNKFELSCYDEIVTDMLESILKGNCILFTNDDNLPNLSKEKQVELIKLINKILKYNHNDLSPKGILNDENLLILIMALSSYYEISYQERLNLMKRYRVREKTLKKKTYNGLIPYRDDLEYVDEKENRECLENIDILKELLKIFADYEEYNNGKEMTYNVPINIDIRNNKFINDSTLSRLYFDILRNSMLCILLPGVKNIIIHDSKISLDSLPVTKIVIGKDVKVLLNVFNNCDNLQEIDIRFTSVDRAYKDGFNVAKSFKPFNYQVSIDYSFIEKCCLKDELVKEHDEVYHRVTFCDCFQGNDTGYYYSVIIPIFLRYKNYFSSLVKNRPDLLRILEGFVSYTNVNDNPSIQSQTEIFVELREPLGNDKPFTLIVRKDDKMYYVNVEYVLKEYDNRNTHYIKKKSLLANEIIHCIEEKEFDSNMHSNFIISSDEYEKYPECYIENSGNFDWNRYNHMLKKPHVFVKTK